MFFLQDDIEYLTILEADAPSTEGADNTDTDGTEGADELIASMKDTDTDQYNLEDDATDTTADDKPTDSTDTDTDTTDDTSDDGMDTADDTSMDDTEAGDDGMDDDSTSDSEQIKKYYLLDQYTDLYETVSSLYDNMQEYYNKSTYYNYQDISYILHTLLQLKNNIYFTITMKFTEYAYQKLITLYSYYEQELIALTNLVEKIISIENNE